METQPNPEAQKISSENQPVSALQVFCSRSAGAARPPLFKAMHVRAEQMNSDICCVFYVEPASRPHSFLTGTVCDPGKGSDCFPGRGQNPANRLYAVGLVALKCFSWILLRQCSHVGASEVGVYIQSSQPRWPDRQCLCLAVIQGTGTNPQPTKIPELHLCTPCSSGPAVSVSS